LSPAPVEEGPPTLPAGLSTVRTETGLEYLDIEIGRGKAAAAGRKVRIRFRGWLTEGSLFDSTDERGPSEITVGSGEVIPALDEGVLRMKVGGRRRLIVPSDLGYGSRGRGKAVPPYASLILDIELLAVS
jgi:FKBP-type peptidyl-prolyl cis-trans isomerase